MKKLFITLLTATSLLLAVATTSCGNSSKESSTANDSVSATVAMLDKYVNELKSKLPADLGNGIVCTDMYISDGYYTQVYELDGSIEALNDTPEMRETARNAISSQVLDLFRTDSIGIRYIYREKGTDNEKTISIPASEL